MGNTTKDMIRTNDKSGHEFRRLRAEALNKELKKESKHGNRRGIHLLDEDHDDEYETSAPKHE